MDSSQFKFFFNEKDLRKQITEGDVERFIYTGENIQIVLYHFPPNKTFPNHFHKKEEQMGFMFSGKMVLKIEGKEKTLLPGDFYHAPTGVEHNAWTLDEPAVLIDIFSPVRDDLIGD